MKHFVSRNWTYRMPFSENNTGKSSKSDFSRIRETKCFTKLALSQFWTAARCKCSAEAAAPCAACAARPATCMPHCERASGKQNLPFHLFLVMQHSCLLTPIRLRALLPPHPLSSLPFFHTSAVAPASLTFSPLAALAEYFYCEHCMFSVSFLCEKKS